MRKERTAQCWEHRNIKQSAVTAAEDRSTTKHHTDVGFLDLNDVSKSCCENIMPYIFFSYLHAPNGCAGCDYSTIFPPGSWQTCAPGYCCCCGFCTVTLTEKVCDHHLLSNGAIPL